MNTEQLTFFDILGVPAVGTWFKSPGAPITFNDICRKFVNRVVLVDLCGNRVYKAVRIEQVLYYDHQNPKNTDTRSGHWCRRIVYNGGGKDNSFTDEYDKDKDNHFFNWIGAVREY